MLLLASFLTVAPRAGRGEAAARDIPDSELLELPGVGYIPHLEIPDKSDAALLNFLRPA